MAKLRHFAIVVRDQEKSAKFYEEAFGLKRAGREDLGWSSAVYLSDGVVNLALLNFTGEKGSGRTDMKDFVGAHHFGFIVDDIAETQKKVEAAGGTFFMDLGDNAEKENFERKFKDPDGLSSTFPARVGQERKAGANPDQPDAMSRSKRSILRVSTLRLA